MFKVKCLNPIAAVGLNQLGRQCEVSEDMNTADAVLVRSAAMHDMEFPKTLKAVARAGAGVNNIPIERCSENGIVVFNTPGANANGVKEAVIAGLLLASRDYVGGIEWVKSEKDNADIAKLTEKQKKAFAGCEISGKKIGVIGLGAIGVLVANICDRLGMEVYGYDPYISVEAAWKLSSRVHHVDNVDDIYAASDFITIHVPLIDATKKMFNAEAISKMKDGVVLLNFARDLLADEEAVAEALKCGKIRKYVSDFPTPLSASMENAIVIPHLGASTAESEDNCAVMAARELRDFLGNGNITHSVNYPDCNMGICKSAGRVIIFHKNVPNMIAQFTSAFAADNINISDMINKSRGEWAYTMVDVESPATAKLVSDIEAIKGCVRVSVIK